MTVQEGGTEYSLSSFQTANCAGGWDRGKILPGVQYTLFKADVTVLWRNYHLYSIVCTVYLYVSEKMVPCIVLCKWTCSTMQLIDYFVAFRKIATLKSHPVDSDGQ